MHLDDVRILLSKSSKQVSSFIHLGMQKIYNLFSPLSYIIWDKRKFN